MTTRALVVLSGGQDSTTCLFIAKQAFDEVHAITFDYGQRHKIELESAKIVGEMAGVASHEFIKLGDHILESTSPLVSDAELEQYENVESLPGEGIEKTFVPMRNQLFLTIAANRAIARGCPYIFTGVCQEDFGGYPDCRNNFIRRLSYATNTSLGDNMNLLTFVTPLMFMTKTQSVLRACDTPGCYKALAYTHTAYDGQYPPRGKDHATLLRAKGFEGARIPDPLLLRAVYIDEVMSPDELPQTDTYDQKNVEFWYAKLFEGADEDGLSFN